MNSTGIRKTLRHGRGEVLPPLHISLCRNDRLSTQALKRKSWNSTTVPHPPPPQKTRGTTRLYSAHVFSGLKPLAVAGGGKKCENPRVQVKQPETLTKGSSLLGRAWGELGKRRAAI